MGKTGSLVRGAIARVRSNLIAFVALFVALGGSAFAATQLAPNSVGTKQIRNKSVTLAKLAPKVRKRLGSVGPSGGAGPAGAPGVAGAAGQTGERGPSGADGSRGPVGPKGEDGARGPAGADGQPGPTGDRGAKGDDGARGPAGVDGQRGPTGDRGPAGADGDRGPMGPTGERGLGGADGERGPTGPEGPRGQSGAAGEPGPTGADGARGVPGPTGDRGPTGDAGESGPAGQRGPAGPTGSQGPAGQDGLGLIWHGPWNVLTQYLPRDIVQSGGSSYIAVVANSGEAPGTTMSWQLVAARGDEGPRGLQGEPGPTGAVGPTGPAGPTGVAGPTGGRGAQGPTGDSGPTGARGLQGDPGVPGATGPIGPTGPAGQVLQYKTDATTVVSHRLEGYIDAGPSVTVTVPEGGLVAVGGSADGVVNPANCSPQFVGGGSQVYEVGTTEAFAAGGAQSGHTALGDWRSYSAGPHTFRFRQKLAEDQLTPTDCPTATYSSSNRKLWVAVMAPTG